MRLRTTHNAPYPVIETTLTRVAERNRGGEKKNENTPRHELWIEFAKENGERKEGEANVVCAPEPARPVVNHQTPHSFRSVRESLRDQSVPFLWGRRSTIP
jgi:hypothetical protein